MVAIVTGQGLGLDRSSGEVLGGLGQMGQLGTAAFGRYGEQVYVNASNGNLMLERNDEVLLGQGLNDIVSRSYNSIGGIAQGYDAHNDWQFNATSRTSHVTLNGPYNTSGSTITRIDSDRSDMVYTYNTTLGAYVCDEGGEAYHRLTYSSSTVTCTWTDGRNGITETYDMANAGRITATTDAYGNSLSYTYTGSLLTKVTTDDGEYTTLTWSGTNLTQVTTTLADSSTLTRVYYTYDSSNRLTAVKTDLTPTDNSISDGNIVTTTYGYDGTSNRITSISQTGGAQLTIGYTSVSGTYRVRSDDNVDV